jgi:hypothetical protein
MRFVRPFSILPLPRAEADRNRWACVTTPITKRKASKAKLAVLAADKNPSISETNKSQKRDTTVRQSV